LHQVIELVKNRDTREPMSAFNQPLSEPMALFVRTLRENGLTTLVRWNRVMNCPPLVINEGQIHEGLAILDTALSAIDAYYEG
jgi:taurine--2-oxoglutarate transaminase